MSTIVYEWNKASRKCVDPFPNDKFSTLPNSKSFQTTIFKFDENEKKFSKRVENTVGKGEIALYEHFSFPHSVFKYLVLQTRKNQGLLGKELIFWQKHGTVILTGNK